MLKARRIGTAIALAATVLAIPSVRAADLGYAPPSAQPFGWLSEIRAGGFVHDPLSPEKGTVDFNGELLFGKRAFTGWDALVPRFHVGSTINFAGKTSHVYAGATWTYDVTSAIFLEATFGGAANNGVRLPTPGRNAMGCAVTFRESATAGFRITQNWSVMATVEHMSNAGLCVENRGLTNAGLRLGYTF
jgi:hypothetical protein